MATYFGMNPPFWGGPQNILSRQEDEKLIKNDLLQLLLTVPGERVHRPSFGVQLRTAIFEQNTPDHLAALEVAISEAIATHEPRVRVLELSLTAKADSNAVNIKLVTELVKDPKVKLTIDRLFSTES